MHSIQVIECLAWSNSSASALLLKYLAADGAAGEGGRLWERARVREL